MPYLGSQTYDTFQILSANFTKLMPVVADIKYNKLSLRYFLIVFEGKRLKSQFYFNIFLTLNTYWILLMKWLKGWVNVLYKLCLGSFIKHAQSFSQITFLWLAKGAFFCCCSWFCFTRVDLNDNQVYGHLTYLKFMKLTLYSNLYYLCNHTHHTQKQSSF